MCHILYATQYYVKREFAVFLDFRLDASRDRSCVDAADPGRTSSAKFKTTRPALHRSGLVNVRFQFPDILDHRLTPAVDVRPLTVANAVLEAGNVDQVSLALSMTNG